MRRPPIDGVVYLDAQDRKMVLLGASGTSVKLEECGLEPKRRFTFYDQVLPRTHMIHVWRIKTDS